MSAAAHRRVDIVSRIENFVLDVSRMRRAVAMRVTPAMREARDARGISWTASVLLRGRM